MYFSAFVSNNNYEQTKIVSHLLEPFVGLAQFDRLPIWWFVSKLWEKDELAF